MNRIYKLKFDKRRNELVVVSEITAGMGKEKSTGHIADLPALSPFRKLLGTLTPVSLLTGLISGLLPAMVLAADLPTGGQIVGGQGSISTSGNQMTIHQQTQNMATNWHSFDIGKNNTVQFVQPDSSSVALNRVTGASGSQIMGTLKANGQVFILNPNGVLFGKNARVDVGGLVASTKNISTADFMKGQYTLSGEGNPGAQVINQGSLTTSKGGYIVLAGERVSNSGTVTTPGGKTVLAAGKTVTLQLDNGGLTSVSVNGSVVNALVENRGLISASNGQVYLTAKGQDMLLNTVVNNSGTVEAKGLVSRDGEIVLDGGDSGVVSQSGQLLADSQTGQGGKITLEGQNIHLAGGSLTSATGKTGGGEVYVGGGWQGKDSRITNASKVVMDKTATVDVSATEAGNGGTAVLWSDDYTNFRGTVLAKGGSQSGNGGRVETSSHRNLQASGTVDASSPSGKGGEWLLDPTDVTIVGSGADSNIDSTTNAGIFTPTASGAQILNTSIVSQLNAGTNVTVKTSGTDTGGQTGNITVNADIVKTAGADTKLTLLADNNIATADNVSIGATTGKLNLDLLAGNITDNASVVLGRNINISLNGGDFYAGPGNTTNNISLQYSNNGKIAAGNITMNLTRGLSGYAYKVQADNDLTINGPVSGSTGWSVPLSFIAGGKLTINSPEDISLVAAETTNGGGRVVIQGDKGVSLNTVAGNISLTAASATTNSVNVSSDNGAVSMSAGGNLSLVCATVTSGTGQDVTFGAAGKAPARVNITGSTINTDGGNISIDHAAEGQAMTVLISSSTLNASAADNGQGGNITLRAYNPNVDLMVSALTGTVRNGGSMIDIGNSSILRGENITTETTQKGSNSRSLPFYMHGATFEAVENITLSGVATDGAVPAQMELRGAGNTLKTTNGNISLKSDVGSVLISGANASVMANITSDLGGVTISGASASSYGVQINNANLSAVNGVINISGIGSILTDQYNQRGAVTLAGNIVTNARGVNISGNNLGRSNSYMPVAGVYLGDSGLINWDMYGGDVNVYGEAKNGAGVIFGVQTSNNKNILNVHASSLNITGCTSATSIPSGVGVAGVYTSSYVGRSSGANFTLYNNADVYIFGDASRASNKIQGISTGTVMDGDGPQGFAFSGNGNVYLHGISNDGDGVKLDVVNNKFLTGNITIRGESNSGAGVYYGRGPDVELVNAIVNGSSNSGAGLLMISGAAGSKFDLNGNVLTGASETGNGVSISGSNVTITNGTLTGKAMTGSGSGVVLTGNSNYMFDNMSVTGTAVDGSGISVNGTLTVNNGSQFTGRAIGSGDGVTISGKLTTSIGGGIIINGEASSGDGIKVSGDATLTNATLKGQTDAGNGVSIVGNLTADNASQVMGQATAQGTGVSVSGTVTGGKVDGTATSGDAVRIVDSRLTDTEVKGESQTGAGVKTQGNVTLQNTELSATSENGVADMDVSGTLDYDEYSAINAVRVAGKEDIPGLQPDTPPSLGDGGATGSGGNTTPDTGDSGDVAGGDTGSGESGGAVTPPSGGTGGDAGNNGNTGSTAGSEGSIPDNNAALPSGVPGPAIREQILVSALRQQAVDAQVTRMNQATPDGFHSAATPVVPVTGYQAKPQNVEINLCDEESCQPETLDAARPAEGVVTSSGK
ncbi:filamentous hemagglutinin N-terminal domain-containing protein [Salmonella enterica]|nr:filamentous hemagglutinin N-terminal domain-containing protein [Salmonella enterica]